MLCGWYEFGKGDSTAQGVSRCGMVSNCTEVSRCVWTEIVKGVDTAQGVSRVVGVSTTVVWIVVRLARESSTQRRSPCVSWSWVCKGISDTQGLPNNWRAAHHTPSHITAYRTITYSHTPPHHTPPHHINHTSLHHAVSHDTTPHPQLTSQYINTATSCTNQHSTSCHSVSHITINLTLSSHTYQ